MLHPVISAKVICASSHNGNQITTFELEYPRFIHSELMTHRQFSRNAASSRAIPINTMNTNIDRNPACPIEWGMNNPGMQSKTLANEETKDLAEIEWTFAKQNAINASYKLSELGIHKQIVNRVTEPYQTMKTIVTSTEWDNWFELRNHPDAQPEIHELARLMLEAKNAAVYINLQEGEWHLPYIGRNHTMGALHYFIENECISLEDAKMLSVSCCAQVSYRKSDMSKEKALIIYEKLVGMTPFHASPFEHQATPIGYSDYDYDEWPAGVTHMCRDGSLGSGNLKHWIQLRQLM